MLREQWSMTRNPTPRGPFGDMAGDTLNQALHAVSAALLTGDTRPITETAQWIAEVLQARGLITQHFSVESH